jgi:hypothetical protein
MNLKLSSKQFKFLLPHLYRILDHAFPRMYAPLVACAHAFNLKLGLNGPYPWAHFLPIKNSIPHISTETLPFIHLFWVKKVLKHYCASEMAQGKEFKECMRLFVKYSAFARYAARKRSTDRTPAK